MDFLTADELAKRLKVSRSVVRRWTLSGLPCLRLGEKLVRFELDASLRWLEERGRKTTERQVA